MSLVKIYDGTASSNASTGGVGSTASINDIASVGNPHAWIDYHGDWSTNSGSFVTTAAHYNQSFLLRPTSEGSGDQGITAFSGGSGSPTGNQLAALLRFSPGSGFGGENLYYIALDLNTADHNFNLYKFTAGSLTAPDPYAHNAVPVNPAHLYCLDATAINSNGAVVITATVSDLTDSTQGPWSLGTTDTSNPFLDGVPGLGGNAVVNFARVQVSQPAPPPATVSNVTVSPNTATGSQQFTAAVSGTNSPAQTVTWTATGGTISSTGAFTAPSATSSVQTITVTATSTVDPSRSGTATVTIAATTTTTPATATVSNVAVTPTTATLSGGGNQQFAVSVTGTNSPSQAVTWTASVGTISASGLYTAPTATSSAQTATITAKSTLDVSKTGTAAVTISAMIVVPIPVVTTGTFPPIPTGLVNPTMRFADDSNVIAYQLVSVDGTATDPSNLGMFAAGSFFGTPNVGLVIANPSVVMAVRWLDAAGNSFHASQLLGPVTSNLIAIAGDVASPAKLRDQTNATTLDPALTDSLANAIGPKINVAGGAGLTPAQSVILDDLGDAIASGFVLAPDGLDSIDTTELPRGETPNFAQRVVQTHQRFHNKVTIDGNGITVYGADEETVLTNQPLAQTITSQTQGALR